MAELAELSRKKSSIGGGKAYWVNCLKAAGLVETSDRRIRFDERLSVPKNEGVTEASVLLSLHAQQQQQQQQQPPPPDDQGEHSADAVDGE